MDWASSWLMPGTLASSSTPAFFTSCKPPRYLSSACRRFGPTPGISSRVLVVRAFARLARWPVMAKRWDSSRMCWMRCKAGMSAGRCSSSWLSPRIRVSNPALRVTPLAMPTSSGYLPPRNSSWRTRISSARRNWPRPPSMNSTSGTLSGSCCLPKRRSSACSMAA